LAVHVPGWRPDVTREVDLIEEIARLKGYDAFPDELRPYRPGTVPDAPVEQATARVRQQLVRAGLYEARTIPLGPPDGPDAVAIRNPMSAEEAHLRRRLIPGLVRRVEHNWANRNRDIRLFEVGTVFRTTQQAPEEWDSVAGVLTGARHPPHWSGGAKVPDMDIWDLKHHFELAVRVAAPSCTVQPATGGWEAVQPGGAVVGWSGPLEADAPVWAAPLFGFEVRLLVAAPEVARYRPLPTQPPLERDVALLLPAGVSAAAVSALLARARPQGRSRAEGERDPGRWDGGDGRGRGGAETRPRDAEPRRRSGAGEQDVAPARGGRARTRARFAVAPDIPRGAGPPARRQRWRDRQRAEPRKHRRCVSEHQEARGQGDDRRRGVHGALRLAAGEHPRRRGVRRSGPDKSPVPGADRRDAQGGHPRRARHHQRAVPDEEGRAGSRRSAGSAGG